MGHWGFLFLFQKHMKFLFSLIIVFADVDVIVSPERSNERESDFGSDL
jgi:hypothetical protein